MDYKQDIEMLKTACHSVASEWGYDFANEYFKALERIESMLEGKYKNNENVYAYVISKLDSQKLYEALKKELKFEVLVECLKMINKDLRECLQNETSI